MLAQMVLGAFAITKVPCSQEIMLKKRIRTYERAKKLRGCNYSHKELMIPKHRLQTIKIP